MIRIAVTAGDTNGIGPEVALKALASVSGTDVRYVLIGDRCAVEAQAQACNLPAPPECDPEDPEAPPVCLRDPAPQQSAPYRPGAIDPQASAKAAAAILLAVEGCLGGSFQAMVTAPICKEGLSAAGLSDPGHTEMLARLSGTRSFAMMLMGGGLRVALVTRHLPLREVPEALTTAAILETVALLAAGLPWLDCPSGRIGVCGLNPHAGDGGALGSEEQDVILPAIEQARAAGYPVAGPLPADAAFYQARQGRYDALVAMYHDQGLGPLKLLAFDRGINVTLGLPLARTSPDHGTAFDLAGSNRADPASMEAALNAARGLARRPNPWAPSLSSHG